MPLLSSGVFRGNGVKTGRAQIFPSEDVLNQPQRHADAGQSEAPMPIDGLTDVTASERRKNRADVDPHVENRETGVAAAVILTVKLAHHGTDARLQQSGSDYDESQSEVEGEESGDRHAEMAKRDDDTAIEHGAALAQDAVGNPTAGQVHQVHHGGVETINRPCFSYVEAETALIYAGDHEQDEECPHAVVAEALPHFREEKGGEATGMAEEALVLAGWSLAFPEGRIGDHGFNSIIYVGVDFD